MESHDRLRRARIGAGFSGPDEAATRFGWNRNTYKSNENGNAPFSFKKAKDYAEAFGVRPEWLYDGTGAIRPNLVSVIGKVGAYWALAREFGGGGNHFQTMADRLSVRVGALVGEMVERETRAFGLDPR